MWRAGLALSGRTRKYMPRKTAKYCWSEIVPPHVGRPPCACRCLTALYHGLRSATSIPSQRSNTGDVQSEEIVYVGCCRLHGGANVWLLVAREAVVGQPRIWSSDASNLTFEHGAGWQPPRRTRLPDRRTRSMFTRSYQQLCQIVRKKSTAVRRRSRSRPLWTHL
jgi:hypothetical protein